MPEDSLIFPGPAVGSAVGALKVVTYNIHACVGVDRQYDPARVAGVLRGIDADIACLQEVGGRRRLNRHADQWAYLAEATGRRIILGAGIGDHQRRFDNAILTRFPVREVRAIDLTVPGHAPRSAIDAELAVGDRVLRVIATHFGLSAGERRLQAARLIAALGEGVGSGSAADAILLMGDLNEWRGRAGAIGALDRHLGPSAAPRTFPSWMPMLPLDRIYADGPAVLSEVSVDRSPLARLASDHLPLIGSLRWHGNAPHRRERPPVRTPGGRRRAA